MLVFIAHGRRELVRLGVTAPPTAAWVWRQLVEATPWGRRPRHLLRDRDAVYGGDFRERAKARGIETVLTPVRASRAFAVAERVIGTLRRACLDHVIPVDERHLRAILAEYVGFPNRDRPHRTLRVETPRQQARPRAAPIPAVRARPVLGGLHHAYEPPASAVRVVPSHTPPPPAAGGALLTGPRIGRSLPGIRAAAPAEDPRSHDGG